MRWDELSHLGLDIHKVVLLWYLVNGSLTLNVAIELCIRAMEECISAKRQCMMRSHHPPVGTILWLNFIDQGT